MIFINNLLFSLTLIVINQLKFIFIFLFFKSVTIYYPYIVIINNTFQTFYLESGLLCSLTFYLSVLFFLFSNKSLKYLKK